MKNPCFSMEKDGPNGADLAIMVLEKPSKVTPVPIYDGDDEEGKDFTLVGWGDSAK